MPGRSRRSCTGAPHGSTPGIPSATCGSRGGATPPLTPERRGRRPPPPPDRPQGAVRAAEDAPFHSHIGIDFPGVARAAIANLRHFRFVQGGSTITQQLAKNFFLTPEKSLWRKVREAELALLMEIRFSKKQILEAYLNKIYFGQEGARGIYGVEEAGRVYFSRR